MKNLNKEIAKLKAENDHEKNTKKLLGKIDHLALLTGHDNEGRRVVVRTKNLEEVRKTFKLFPASNKVTKIDFAGSDDITLKTPFRIDIENPAQQNSAQSYHLSVGYQSGKIEMDIEIPLNLLPTEFFTRGQRPITDCEYHYFIGHSYNELRNIRVTQYSFQGEQIGWFGGNKTAKDLKEVSKIIDTILGKEK